MQVTSPSIIQVPGSYKFYEMIYEQVGVIDNRPVYQYKKEPHRFFVHNGENLVGLDNGRENRSRGCFRPDGTGDLVTIDLSRYKSKKGRVVILNTKSASEHFWTAISTLNVIVGLRLKVAFLASTAAVCTIAYAQRTIVHFVPAVVNTMVNGTLTDVLSFFCRTGRK